MAAHELGPWAPLSVDAVVDRFAGAPFRWWMSGGRALALHLGRTWRDHDDTDVGILRTDVAAAVARLGGWDVQVAAAGRLTPWTDRPLTAERHENNVWCRPGPDAPWALDLTLNDGDESAWVSRRDPSITRPWAATILRSEGGVPYLAPELQLLFKAKGHRPKDDLDAATVIPALDPDRRRWLAEHLDAGHPWLDHLAAGGD